MTEESIPGIVGVTIRVIVVHGELRERISEVSGRWASIQRTAEPHNEVDRRRYPDFQLVSAPRSCTGDEGKPLGAGLQGQARNHLKLLPAKAGGIVSVKEKAP
jgi:hypothetical protein